MRIVYVIDKMAPGGAQTHLAGLITALDRTRFEPALICLGEAGAIAERVSASGVTVESLGLERIYGLKATRAFLGLVRRLGRTRPEIVHTYLSSANVFGAAAARLASVGCVITSRRDTGFGDSRVMTRALRLSNRWARRVVAVSRDAARVAEGREGLRAPQLAVIPNGIDLDRFRPRGRREAARRALGVPADARVVVTLAHLTVVKGIDLLVEAAAQVKSVAPGAVFMVAGAGGERDGIARRAQALGLDGDFRLVGRHPDVPELLEAADLLVLPSRSEGQPNALLEAMAMGLPVVATRVGGVPEVATHDREALLVPPEDPGALARACLEILASPDLARRLGAAGRERAARDFSVKTMVERYQRLYQDALAGAR